MNNNYIKYGILSFLGLLTIKMYIHFGDYCSGMFEGLIWLFLCFIFILSSIVIVVYDLIKRKFDYKIYIIILIVFLLNLFFITQPLDESENNKDAVLIGYVDHFYDKQITLNENESFVITIKQVEWTCYKKGNYEIKDNILTLKKDNLIQETDSLFTYKYKIDLKNKVLIPLEKGFNKITIQSTNKTP
ncbi:hypothetical protein [Flavobacterium nackdongense]|uniref:Uncharacterized protein n=1 Tax=Flavobacterium nackdongense TaxID=2547394 RepID=A0A4P6YH21_9FLAO|nr:hypothetical protein [Flavobacterium nackdongense]QBN20127.1 hypothetical protein E1750_15415 [Flavobacterium nackdongense]